jgi:hypothetical protein
VWWSVAAAAAAAAAVAIPVFSSSSLCSSFFDNLQFKGESGTRFEEKESRATMNYMIYLFILCHPSLILCALHCVLYRVTRLRSGIDTNY